MPNIASSKKRVRTTAKRTAINTARKTRVRGFIRKVEEAITSGDKNAALAARVVPADLLLAEVLKAAQKIAAQSSPAAQMVKEAVNRALEASLAEGLHFERRLFHAMFATADQKEGMAAFAEKRKPAFKDE